MTSVAHPGGLVLQLRPDVQVASVSDTVVVLEGRHGRVNLGGASPGLRAAVGQLAGDGATAQELADRVVEADGTTGLACLYYVLRMGGRQNLLRAAVRTGRDVLARATAMRGALPIDAAPVPADAPHQLSRFALLRRDGETMVLESPRTPVVVELPTATGIRLVTALTRPRSAADLAAAPDVVSAGTTVDDVRWLLGLLAATEIVMAVDAHDASPEDEDPVVRTWEFHDLLFHARSRLGRHDRPYGATYRFLDQLPPLPAIEPAAPGSAVSLHRPDVRALARDDPPFTDVLERRRSVREHADEPITIRQLGEFLYRVARVRTTGPADPDRGRPYETSSRPYPSGGATYDLELYLTVTACQGLDPGLYHYGPGDHELRLITGPDDRTTALLDHARWSAGLTGDPQVLITLASRFQRLSWKYASMAYATTLKNVGVLLQTMYLVATAMDLAGCALGGGDADAFTAAAGTDYYAESSVGEFMLGGMSIEPGVREDDYG